MTSLSCFFNLVPAFVCLAIHLSLYVSLVLNSAHAGVLPGSWELLVENAGVSAMHMTITPANTLIMYDRTDYGASELQLPGGKCRNDSRDLALKVDCYAHSIELNLRTNYVRPLEVLTDTWCSSGAFLADGTFVSIGGYNDGAQAIRYFVPCDDGSCDWDETSDHLASPRWYASNQILPDGRIIVVGGRRAFSYEFAPKSSGAVQLPLLAETKDPKAENNLYPFLHLSSDGNLFIFANTKSILLDYKSNLVVRTFPELPGGSRNYPSSGCSVMFPLKSSDSFQTVEVMICGGAPEGAYEQVNANSFPSALSTCGRMVITDANPSWEVEEMPDSRVMGDMIILPTGEILIINGAKEGQAGWDKARNPALAPALYSPSAASGVRFQELASTSIPRLYHASSVLLPDGRIIVGGSNPNVGYAFTNVLFPTELRIEAFSPYYLDSSFDIQRPTITGLDQQISYSSTFRLTFSVQKLSPDLELRLSAPTFSTHTVGMNQRQLILQLINVTAAGSGYAATAAAPPNSATAPAGYYMLFVVNDGVPSAGTWVRVS